MENLVKKRKEILEQGRASEEEYEALKLERNTAEAMHAELVEAMNKRVYEVSTVEAPAVIVRKASM